MKIIIHLKIFPNFCRYTASNTWRQHLYILDGTKEQCNLYHPLGPHITQRSRKPFLLFFLVFYILTVVGNPLIVVTEAVSNTELNNVLFLDSLWSLHLVYSSSAPWRLISDLFFGGNAISFESCMTQLFTEHVFGGSEISLMLVMWV